jgi:exodeoxyribonuclease VII small subunit
VPKDNARPEQYSDVVARLKDLVEALEGGELSLEQSLERFSEGVALVKKGEKLLTDAEKRIEQLLSDDGRTGPLQTAEAPPAPARAAAKKPSPADDEDVPF